MIISQKHRLAKTITDNYTGKPMITRKFFFVLTTIMLCSIFAFEIFAQDVQESDKVEYQKRTVIDFSDVVIQGELTKPSGSYLPNRKRTNFKTLLTLRDNFITELELSVDNL